MFRIICLLVSFLLIIIFLLVFFYFEQRIVYIDNFFEGIDAKSKYDNISYDSTIVGDWSTVIDSPITISTYGAPYKLLLSITSTDEIDNILLLDLSIQYSSSTCFLKNFNVNYSTLKAPGNYEYYLSVKDIPIVHENGKTFKLKYKLRLIINEKVFEKEIETEFKAKNKFKKSYKIIDMYMGV